MNGSDDSDAETTKTGNNSHENRSSALTNHDLHYFRQQVHLENTGRSTLCLLSGNCCEELKGLCDGVERNILAWLGPLVVLTWDSRSSFPTLQTLFPAERPVVQDHNPPIRTVH